MNKRLIIIGVLIVLALAGGGYFMFANKTSKPAPSSVTTQENQPQEVVDSSQQTSLKELLASGKSQECNFSDNIENVNVSGTVRFANSKMRGDFNSQTDEGIIKSHMIVDDKTIYIWTDGQTQGFKMSLDAIPSPNANVKTEGVDINKKINYQCESWNGGTTEFTLPNDIKFQDFSSFLPTGSAKPGSSGSSSQCAVCDSLSGEAKTQCLTALSCD